MARLPQLPLHVAICSPGDPQTRRTKRSQNGTCQEVPAPACGILHLVAGCERKQSQLLLCHNKPGAPAVCTGVTRVDAIKGMLTRQQDAQSPMHT
jgi:hypothetical protein